MIIKVMGFHETIMLNLNEVAEWKHPVWWRNGYWWTVEMKDGSELQVFMREV